MVKMDTLKKITMVKMDTLKKITMVKMDTLKKITMVKMDIKMNHMILMIKYNMVKKRT